MNKELKNIITSATIGLTGSILGLLSIIYSNIELFAYISGSLAILLLIAYVLYDLIYSDDKGLFEYIGIGYNFFVSVVVCAFMISNIKDDNIRTIVLALAAAIYGGLLTLIGVAWTIKKSDRDKKEDEEKKSNPFIFIQYAL